MCDISNFVFSDFFKLLDSHFFTDHWRNKPAIFRGAFVPEHLKQSNSALESFGYDLDTESRTGVRFVEGITRPKGAHSTLVNESRKFFEWPNIWLDIFDANENGSIGAHIDNSDNFSFQLSGTKVWKLGPSSYIDFEQRRLRLLGDPNSGDVVNFIPTLEFTLNPGDILYIPLLWQHHGTTVSCSSQSLSLVLNAETPWEFAQKSLLRKLPHDSNWTNPLPVGPGSRDSRSLVFRHLEVPDFDNQDLRDSDRQRLLNSSSFNGSHSNTLSVVKRFIASSPTPPQTDFVVPTDARDVAPDLTKLLARKNLKHFFTLVLGDLTKNCLFSDQMRYGAIIETVLQLKDLPLEEMFSSWQFTSWISVAKLHRSTIFHTFDNWLLDRLCWIMLPYMHGRTRSEMLTSFFVPSSYDGTLVIQDGSYLFDSKTSENVPWRISPSQTGFVATKGTSVDEIIFDSDFNVSRSDDRTDFVSARMFEIPDRWLSRFGLGGTDYSRPTTRDVADFRKMFMEGYSLLLDVYPEFARQVEDTVFALVPSAGVGLDPLNFSVHAFRGLVCSSARPAVMAAQILVHESGHNLMSTILDLFPVCRNPGLKVVSPVVNAPRTLPALFHGAYSFARECVLCEALLSSGVSPVSGTSLSRYLSGRQAVVRDTLTVLEEVADLTPIGRQILHEIHQIVRGSS